MKAERGWEGGRYSGVQNSSGTGENVCSALGRVQSIKGMGTVSATVKGARSAREKFSTPGGTRQVPSRGKGKGARDEAGRKGKGRGHITVSVISTKTESYER